MEKTEKKVELFRKKGNYLLKHQLNSIFKNIKYYDEYITCEDCLNYIYEKIGNKEFEKESIFFNQFKWRLLDYYRIVCDPIKQERSFNNYYHFLTNEFKISDEELNILLYTIDARFNKFIILDSKFNRKDGKGIDSNYFKKYYKYIIERNTWSIEPNRKDIAKFLKSKLIEFNYDNLYTIDNEFDDTKIYSNGRLDEDGYWSYL